MKGLGNRQKGVLRALISHRRYYDGCGWAWEGHKTTLEILETLVRRGLVKNEIKMLSRPKLVYTPTEAGLEQARAA